METTLYTIHIVLVPRTIHDRMQGHFFPQRDLTVAAIPRVGEFLVNNDREGRGQAFKVLGVFHPLCPDGHKTVELRVSHVGTEVELFQSFESGEAQFFEVER